MNGKNIFLLLFFPLGTSSHLLWLRPNSTGSDRLRNTAHRITEGDAGFEPSESEIWTTIVVVVLSFPYLSTYSGWQRMNLWGWSDTSLLTTASARGPTINTGLGAEHLVWGQSTTWHPNFSVFRIQLSSQC